MNRAAPHISLWGILFAAGAATAGGVGLYWAFRRAQRDRLPEGVELAEEGVESTYVDPVAPAISPIVATKGLAAPLAPPLRKMTPNGYYNAPRPVGTKPGDGKFDHYHQGVDLQGKAGEPVLAVGAGKIVSSKAGLGELVRVLQLDDGRAVVYADLGTATVEPGKLVSAGDQIGTVRKNGFVHVAIRESRYGKFINPKGVIPYAG